MRKMRKILRGAAVRGLAFGPVSFMFVYVVGGGKMVCPLCGNRGIHPWEWSGSLNL